MNRILFLIAGIFLYSLSFGQIPPGYYNSAMGLSGNALKSALHNIIDDHVEYSYDDLRDFILMDTDEDPNNSNNIILLYTGRSQNKNTFGGGADDWNREHVWAKSHGDFGTVPPCGTDAHHMRPTDASVNSSRGNKDFDNGGQQHPEATGCYYTNDTWEPRDEVKGDVARMILYMAVRYEGDNGEPDLEVVDWVNTAPAPQHGKFSTLMSWHVFDPPDAFEINRNNVIYSYQNNRNPFIDHPEFVGMLWDTYTRAEAQASGSLILYPNPASDFISIESPNLSHETSVVSIVSFFGLEVLRESYIMKDKIDLSLLPSGYYIVKIRQEDKFFSKKLNIIK
ncbi:MAG: endonuclease [Bacteroidales bacterium]|nr:endonuclease [Bacteroidales bacterium]MCF8404025.1 endonuclease [Bacteroidales bacterium]